MGKSVKYQWLTDLHRQLLTEVEFAADQFIQMNVAEDRTQLACSYIDELQGLEDR
jgi:hypothetical protein